MGVLFSLLQSGEGQLSCCEVIYRRCPQLLYQENKIGCTALHAAAKYGKREIVNFLLAVEKKHKEVKSGVEGSTDYRLSMRQDTLGSTALHLAVREGYHETAKLLLDADPSKMLLGVVNSERETALHLAVKFQSLEMVKVLIEADPHLEYSADDSGNTPVLIAFDLAMSGDEEKVALRRLLIEHQRDQRRPLTGNNRWTLLHHAVHKRNLGAIKDVIDLWPDCCGLPDVEGQSAFHLAVRSGQVEVVKCILDQKNIEENVLNGRDKDDNTPLHIAVATENFNIALSLLEDSRVTKMAENMEGKKALHMLGEGNHKWTLLHYATHKGNVNAIKEIITFVPDCWDAVNKEGRNFLHLAAMYDKIEVVEYGLKLEKMTIDVLNWRDIHGNTPLHVARSCENRHITNALLEDARVDQTIQNNESKTALKMGPSILIQCASNGDIDFFEAIQVHMLEKTTDEDGESLFSIAAREGHLNCCEVIRKKCPDLLYKPNNNGVSALHTASSNGKQNTVKYLLGACHKMETQGLQNRGSVAEDDGNVYKLLMMEMSENQRTALHFAVDNGHLSSAKLLVDADTEKKLLGKTDNNKETALHYAVKKYDFEIVKLLVEAKPDFEYTDNGSGHTPLSLALQNACLDDPQSIKVKIRSLLVQKQPNQCKRQDESGQTVLHRATLNNDLSALKEIAEYWRECLELVDKDSENFLHLAARLGRKEIVQHIVSLENIRNDVLNGRNKKGETPLHVAIRSEKQNVAELLLYESKVDKGILDKNGKNVLKEIKFSYSKIRAGVLGPVDEKVLKEQSEFDLFVGALISTVAFTAGITVPGGFIPDGPNRGKAILHKNKIWGPC